jgi:sugar lactone lactonase YvrE/enterochelin esterase-like enzyme
LGAISPDDQYVPGPDSERQPAVPQGKIFEFVLDHSKVYPGTSRKISVFIPAEYRADKPACVYVGLDGLGFRVSTVFDNLIYRHEIPVTIAIGVEPGAVDAANEAGASDPRFNRSFEFDGLNDNLARFLVEEVFPEVEARRTPDGLPILLTKDPNDRAAGGASTGGIAAFTLAWERPDVFRRVFTSIGTFVGMRGGDRYPVLVRKTEPKPIRVFMQDGSNDEWMGGPEVGDWWMSNQTMERALKFAGYQVEHIWGQGTHNGNQATAIFPDAMRWLWKDWPKPIQAGQSQNTFLQAILLQGNDWQAISGSYATDGNMTADAAGDVVFYDSASRSTRKIENDLSVVGYLYLGKASAAMAFGPDGRIFVTDASRAAIVSYAPDGKALTIARGIQGNNLVVTHNGSIYVAESGSGDGEIGKVWVIKANGEKQLLDKGLNCPTAIAISPDGLWLAVAEGKTHWGYSYRVLSDGSVDSKQRFYWFHVPDTADDSGVRSWVMDRDGRLYAATRMGVQVFDRNGRVRAILPVPGGEATGVSFGGTGFDTLFVSCADGRIYRRKIRAIGARSWLAPIELPAWFPG